MEKRPLGHRRLSVTPLGLGLAALGRPGYINLGHAADLNQAYQVSAMEARAHAVLDAAWAGGIRYFDAARSYGRAEPFLASWLAARGLDPDQLTVGSKWGYTYTAAWQTRLPAGQKHEVKEHTLANLQRQLAESRAVLGRQLDLYQIHSATLDSGVLENQVVLAELARLRDGGLAIGFSVSGSQQAETIEKALEIRFGGTPLFAAVQATWNLLERSATAALQAAHEAGLGVIIKEALANGRLTQRNDAPHFQHALAQLQTQAQAQNSTVECVALAAVLNRPFVDVVLSGAAQVAHLEANLQALQITWTDALEAALSGLVEPAGQYWHTRSQLAWN
jgi:aryl-alcohol dehydrogenase-like predicted oxidoreductase